MDKVGWDMLLGPLEEIRKRGKTGTGKVGKVIAGGGGQPGGEEKRFGNIKKSDLKVLGLLGCGGFGAVEAVECKKDGQIYALKALSKGYVLKTGMQKSVMSEKNIQLMCDSPFVVKLYETYNIDQNLFFLLEIAIGGELYATYNRKNLWGKLNCARFYIAGTVFAFEHLHNRKIVYRDLKPENLLLNNNGQVKLTDMGLAKVVVGQTFTTCGTPDYFAPEVIGSKGHGAAVDWWTLGILTFELLAGHPPFESPTPQQIYQKVRAGIEKVKFPEATKGTAMTLIKGLCHATPAKRLPMKSGETNNIKQAEWFAGFNWEEMEGVKMTPPYRPAIKSNKDTSNFKARNEDRPPQVAYKDPKTGWDKDFATSS
jgi:cGMP-dependent protein kinase